MSRVSLSTKSARALLAIARCTTNPLLSGDKRAVEELEAALSPRPKSSAVRKTEEKKRSKAAELRDIKAAIFARSKGLCEFLCGRAAVDPHHAFGRVRVKQSERNCLAACRTCHRALTDNNPSAAFWWQRVAFAFSRLGFVPEEGEAWRNHQRALDKAELSRGGAK
jgi:hypothetical protein